MYNTGIVAFVYFFTFLTSFIKLLFLYLAIIISCFFIIEIYYFFFIHYFLILLFPSIVYHAFKRMQ